jgi:hypothetical protein
LDFNCAWAGASPDANLDTKLDTKLDAKLAAHFLKPAIFFSRWRNQISLPVFVELCRTSAAALTGGKTMTNFAKIALAAMLAAPAFLAAQTPAPTPGRHDWNINQRKGDQQQRIGQGVHSGQLTAGETARLERQERGINREERGMRAQDNGRLTSRDRATIHRQQNQESRRIYRDKHNDRVR